MSDFTIEQLEALKEGTTPGLWAAVADYPYVSIVETADEDGESTAIADIVSEKTEITPDHDLMAASPALLDQLIATETKLQKVLNSIEKLRDWYNECGEYMHNLYEESLNPRFEEDSASYAQSADHLTEILEGNND